MSRRETMVKRKFVVATEREVSVGVAKPRREKRVAEKYMREFWVVLETNIDTVLRQIHGTNSKLNGKWLGY